VIVCLVTDRRRLCGAGIEFADARRAVARQTAQAVAAGIDLIQVRERDLDAGRLALLVGDAVRQSRGSGTRVVVNDRLDVAIACGADGVHLRTDSIPAAEVRRIAPAGFLVGRSVHAVSEAATAGPVDYVIAGTVFRTESKVGTYSPIGVEGLRAIVGALEAPVLGIGGIDLDTVGDAARADAAGVAAVGLFLRPATTLAALVDEARRRFDTAKSASYHDRGLLTNGS
jgi:thiamine-phosphate pyrophosphorylase